ncbi:MFS transporter [Dulcicalothrix desertica PCC 7102]|uniref:MFS transporter n=1 Tax=Dulcicalothrix desertica PCC 7102 TaxID=232991 RepID=A0A433VPU1_9CYAN|nr:MFS transporter [Dulcicalothrix desertica]RUT08153.1 MFS transporter [Dulcicalothrix desertica PCC 7102]TWH40023.1 putative MFS family arabinose efflux permease [Dulcicalothrix desertica PCC 7102]
MSKTNLNSTFTKATLLLVSTLTVMSGATIAPSLPAMREYFSNVQNADYLVKLALTLPALFIALGAPLVGIIIDRVGRKPLLIIALIIYGIAGCSGLILNDLTLILVGRALLGISVAGIMTSATTLIADYYIGAARAQFLGLQAAFMGLGGVLFLSIGGFIAEQNWRYPFGIYLFSLLLVPCASSFLLEPERNQPVNKNQEIVTQTQKLPFNLVIITYGIGILTQIVFYLIPVQLPFYLKQLFGAGASQSGIAIALATLFSAMASLLYRQIKAKFSFTAIYGIAFLNIGIGYYFISIGKAYPIILLGLVIAGSGLGLLMPNMNLCLISVTPDTMRGKIISGVTTSLFLGQFLSPLLSQPLSAKVGLANTYASAGGFMFVLAVMALITLYKFKS